MQTQPIKQQKNDIKYQKLNYFKIFNLILHATLLTICVFLSCLFFQNIQSNQQQYHLNNLFEIKWTLNNIYLFLEKWLIFIFIRYIIPLIIVLYMFCVVRTQAYSKILKDQYIYKYDNKFNKMHKLNIPITQSKSNKKLDKYYQSKTYQSFVTDNNDTQNDTLNTQNQESSLNKSIQIVKSMSRSMLGSLKSISNGKKLNNSAVYKHNNSQFLNNSSKKIIQSITNKNIGQSRSKDLSQFFEKHKPVCQSGFLNTSQASSSAFNSESTKVLIKNKKYYDMITENQNDLFQKWHQQMSIKFIKTIKAQNFQKLIIQQNLLMRKGLQRQILSFLKDYKENKENIKSILMKYYCVKIQGYQNVKNSPYQLSNFLNKESYNNSKNIFEKNPSPITKDKIIQEEKLLRFLDSYSQLIQNLKRNKIQLRKSSQKITAEKQIQLYFEKRNYFYTLMNISKISTANSSQIQRKLKLLQKGLNLLSNRRNGLNSLNNIANANNMMLNQMDILQSVQIQNIREMVQVRVSLLIYFVNKINCLTDQKQMKIKMKQAVTYDNGYLNQLINTFKISNFIEVIQLKGYDNIIPHYNLKINQRFNQNPQSVINCQPGIDNPLSVILFLCKKIHQIYKNQTQFNESSLNSQFKKKYSVKSFIESLYPM